MKALVYHGNKDLRLQEILEPEPGPDDAKIRVEFCGICATDIEEYLYGPNFISSNLPNPLTGMSIPLIPGHELTGRITKVGKNVIGVEIGQRVVINGILTCMKCRWCIKGNTEQCPYMACVGFGANGGLAEYFVWPASKLIVLSNGVTSEEAALVEPASVANHAVKRGAITADDNVLVLGVGTVGMLAMQIAKNFGATVFGIDSRQICLDLADELGADATISASSPVIEDRLMELTNGIGPDVIIDSAGTTSTPINAINWVRPGGKVVLVAIYTTTSQLNFNALVSHEKTVLGSVAYTHEDVEEVVGFLSTGTLNTKSLISDVITLDEVIDKGFERMMAPEKDIFRILVSP